jgi:hypothetical protein
MGGQRSLKKLETHAERSDAKAKERDRLTACMDAKEFRSERGNSPQ